MKFLALLVLSSCAHMEFHFPIDPKADAPDGPKAFVCFRDGASNKFVCVDAKKLL